MIRNKLLFIQCIIGLFAILINQLFPDFIGSYQYYFLAVAILMTGMPHGAIDHIISFELDDRESNLRNQLKFYSSYMGLILIYSLLWIYFPMFSFISFMLITAYHFGQADAMRFDLKPVWQWILHISRGITVVGLIIYGDLDYTSPVIESVTGVSLSALINSSPISVNQLKIFLALIYPVCFVMTASLQLKNFRDPVSALLDAVIVSALFYYCDTIWAFSIYFGIWHAFNHIRVMIRFMKVKQKDAGWGWFYRKSFIYSAVTYAGIIALYYILDAFESEELLVFLLFIAISVVTLPHMMIVEKMYGLFGKKLVGPASEQ